MRNLITAGKFPQVLKKLLLVNDSRNLVLATKLPPAFHPRSERTGLYRLDSRRIQAEAAGPVNLVVFVCRREPFVESL